MNRLARRCLAVLGALALAGCASAPPAVVAGAPRYPTFTFPEIPAALGVSATVRERQQTAWTRLQNGDLRGASRDFSALLRVSPEFYPAETGLGYVELADRDYEDAATYFRSATRRAADYLPAWLGLAEAETGAGNDVEAIAAMERVLALDPQRTEVRSRLELVRFREVQQLIEAGQAQRANRQYAQAKASFERALSISPSSTVILRELMQVAAATEAVAERENYARRIVQLEPNDPAAHAELGEVLESQEKYREAAAAYARAASLEARPEWRTRAAELREKADLASIPAEFGSLAGATAVTRAQVAAFVGIRLTGVLENAPRRQAAIATDVRDHWASPWITRVTQAGIMDVFPNHTFQPSATVRRGDLAQVVSAILNLPAVARLPGVAQWRNARPRFSDIATNHVFYRPAALAVTSGAMTAKDDRFDPTRSASGADLSAAVARLAQIVGR